MTRCMHCGGDDHGSNQCSDMPPVTGDVAQPTPSNREAELAAEVDRLTKRLELLAVGFGVPDGGKYIADWQTRIKKYQDLAAQPPAAPVETFKKPGWCPACSCKAECALDHSSAGSVRDYIANYRFEMDGGGSYCPSVREEAMLEDAIEGYIASLPKTSPPTGEPDAWVNGDELDNLLDDRTTLIRGVKSSWCKTPLYRAAPQPATPSSDLAARAAELLTVPMGWGSGPALNALAEKIGGHAEVGARNQTFREALEAVVRMEHEPRQSAVTDALSAAIEAKLKDPAFIEFAANMTTLNEVGLLPVIKLRPTSVSDWIVVLPSGREIGLCDEEWKSAVIPDEPQESHERPTRQELVDALQVMVMAWEAKTTVDGRAQIGLSGAVHFPAMPGDVKSSDDAKRILALSRPK